MGNSAPPLTSENGTSKYTISSWKELAGWIKERQWRGWLFRGETRKEWKLQPKAGRLDESRRSENRVCPENMPEDEVRAFTDFKRLARPHIIHQPTSDLEWMAIAQHHGLPTRLLDWTESALVAAFFAVEDARPDQGPAIIYCVRELEEIDDNDKVNPFDSSQRVGIYRPPHISPRMTAQQSVFTLHPDPQKDFRDEESISLERWEIPGKKRMEIKKALMSIGISYSTLFPDIDGIGKQLRWLYKWSFFREERACGSRQTQPES